MLNNLIEIQKQNMLEESEEYKPVKRTTKLTRNLVIDLNEQ